jgi:hypothetical protein
MTRESRFVTLIPTFVVVRSIRSVDPRDHRDEEEGKDSRAKRWSPASACAFAAQSNPLSGTGSSGASLKSGYSGAMGQFLVIAILVIVPGIAWLLSSRFPRFVSRLGWSLILLGVVFWLLLSVLEISIDFWFDPYLLCYGGILSFCLGMGALAGWGVQQIKICGLVAWGRSLPKVRIVLSVALFVIYVGSYVPLSARGQYGPEFPGSLMEGYVYAWEPKLLHEEHGWNQQLVALYLPLILVDRTFWHRTDQARHFLKG